jgi:hypothetical protein
LYTSAIYYKNKPEYCLLLTNNSLLSYISRLTNPIFCTIFHFEISFPFSEIPFTPPLFFSQSHPPHFYAQLPVWTKSVFPVFSCLSFNSCKISMATVFCTMQFLFVFPLFFRLLFSRENTHSALLSIIPICISFDATFNAQKSTLPKNLSTNYPKNYFINFSKKLSIKYSKKVLSKKFITLFLYTLLVGVFGRGFLFDYLYLCFLFLILLKLIWID